MVKLSLGEAAKESGVSKPTLSRAVKSGKLSADKQPDGSYHIDPSELFRVYPRNSNVKQTLKQNETPYETGASDSILIAKIKLEAENEALKRDVERLEVMVNELRKEKDDWKEQASIVRVIADMRPKTGGFWSVFKKG